MAETVELPTLTGELMLISELMAAEWVTRHDLAWRLNVSEAYLSRYLDGCEEMPPSLERHIFFALGKSLVRKLPRPYKDGFF